MCEPHALGESIVKFCIFSSQSGMREKREKRKKEKTEYKKEKQDVVVKHRDNDRKMNEDRIICRSPWKILSLSLLHLFMNVLIRNKGRCGRFKSSSQFSSNNPPQGCCYKVASHSFQTLSMTVSRELKAIRISLPHTVRQKRLQVEDETSHSRFATSCSL